MSLVVLSYLQSCSSSLVNNNKNSSPHYLLCGHGREIKNKDQGKYRINLPSENVGLMITSFVDQSHYIVPTPCKGHEIVLHPKINGIAFSSSKWGQEAFLIDYNKRKILTEIKTDRATYLFFGHSVFSSDGKRLYCSMQDYEQLSGIISVRDATTLKEIDQIKTDGMEPHQIKWLEQDKILSLVNDRVRPERGANNNSELCFINVNEKKVIQKISLSFDNYAHFSIMENEGLVFRSSEKSRHKSLVEQVSLDNKISTIPSLEFSLGSEALSHVYLPSSSIAIVTITSHAIVAWDYKQKKIVQLIQVPFSPKGIALSQNEKSFFVTFVNEDQTFIKEYETQPFLNGQMIERRTVRGGSGSHLTIVQI